MCNVLLRLASNALGRQGWQMLRLCCCSATAPAPADTLCKHRYLVLCYCCLLVLPMQVRLPATCAAAKLMQMTCWRTLSVTLVVGKRCC
jgi:hypothetical protein